MWYLSVNSLGWIEKISNCFSHFQHAWPCDTNKNMAINLYSESHTLNPVTLVSHRLVFRLTPHFSNPHPPHLSTERIQSLSLNPCLCLWFTHVAVNQYYRQRSRPRYPKENGRRITGTTKFHHVSRFVRWKDKRWVPFRKATCHGSIGKLPGPAITRHTSSDVTSVSRDWLP